MLKKIDESSIQFQFSSKAKKESSSEWDTYDGSNDWPVNNDGGDFDTNAEDSTIIYGDINQWYSWDITDLVNGWLNETVDNYGIILKAHSNSWVHQFYSSDYTGDPNLRPKLVVNFINNSLSQMLDDEDCLSLLDNNGNLVDYISWGAEPGPDDDNAVLASQWIDGTFINTSNLLENETLARDKYATDTDTTTDWENSTTSKAEPYGINAT